MREQQQIIQRQQLQRQLQLQRQELQRQHQGVEQPRVLQRPTNPVPDIVVAEDIVKSSEVEDGDEEVQGSEGFIGPVLNSHFV